MVIGTLIRNINSSTVQTIVEPVTTGYYEQFNPDDQIKQQMLTAHSNVKFDFSRDYNSPIENNNLLRPNLDIPIMNVIYWDTIKQETKKQSLSIWDSPKFTDLLLQPIGSPITLTAEEAAEIVRLAAGRRPDLQKGKDFISEIRELLGHSLIDKLDKSE